jgi:hypothetical protein
MSDFPAAGAFATYYGHTTVRLPCATAAAATQFPCGPLAAAREGQYLGSQFVPSAFGGKFIS